MARIRTIKPDFWTDDRVGECSPTARLLFVATWNFADDEGGLDRSAKQLKAQAFPYDQIDCEPLVQELLKAGLLIEYEADGKKYLHIKGFGVHQKIEKKARARHPIYKESLRTHRGVGEDSVSSAVSSLEGNGMEGNGRDLKNPSAARALPINGLEAVAFTKFKQTYPHRGGNQPWHRALRAIHARLKEGHTWSQLIEGADRYGTFCAATEKIGTEFVMQAATFCGPAKSFLESWDLPNTSAEARLASNLDAAAEFLQRTAGKP